MSGESRLGTSKTKRLLAVAAIWHLAFVLTIFLIGRSQVWPDTFDRNGIGVSFAIDSHTYRIEADALATLIRQGQFRAWLKYNASFHVKVYSLSVAVFGPLVGSNILAVEPLNLFYFLSILTLAYSIAREVFEDLVAQIATCVIAFWPSLLLHTTQLLRDVIFIPAMLLLVFALLLSVTRTLSLKAALSVALAGTLGAILIWLCRGDSWEVAFLTMVAGAFVCVLAQFKQRQFLAGNMLAVGLLLGCSFLVPMIFPTHRLTDEFLAARLRRERANTSTEEKAQAIDKLFNDRAKQGTPISRLAYRVGGLRHGFIHRYPLAGSNLDTDVELLGTWAVIRYLPRAALIGFCAPFPNMWVTRGAQVGLAGRLFAGAEMLVIYFFLAFAGYSAFRERGRLPVWLLVAIALIGCTALGCVIVNISTLYRMRYSYFILVIILGVRGLLYLPPLRTFGEAKLPELQEA